MTLPILWIYFISDLFFYFQPLLIVRLLTREIVQMAPDVIIWIVGCGRACVHLVMWVLTVTARVSILIINSIIIRVSAMFCPSVCLMLGQRLRRWPNIRQILGINVHFQYRWLYFAKNIEHKCLVIKA